MKRSAARILVVDDSPSIVTSLSKILELNGFRVDSAFNGSDALRKIHRHNYDLVICDIEMPGISGLDFLERVRREYERDLDVILMTGFLEQDYFLQAIRLGASDFIRKPVESEHIIHAIQTILEKKRSRTEFANLFSLMDNAQLNIVIDPRKFSQFGISKVFNVFFKQNLKLSQDLCNELLTCVDEMVYNAFIHGTLELTPQQRRYEHDQLQKLIEEKLQEQAIAAKRIRFSFSVNQLDNSISISVEDDGNGFDYLSWLQRVAQEPKLNLDDNGRGLSMLYHLSDRLDFDNNGRKVQITRKLAPQTVSEL